MAFYFAEISYIGTDFFGFQSQPHGNTVQNNLEKIFSQFFLTPTIVTGASRTDSGVHASHQVILFQTEKPFQLQTWLRALNELLPKSIGIYTIQPIPEHFNPKHSSTGKIYCYRLFQGYCANPVTRDFVWSIPYDISIALMNEHVSQMIGIHDFKYFSAPNHQKKTTIRHVKNIEIRQQGSIIELWFAADGFLKQMIRNIVRLLILLQTSHKNIKLEHILTGQEKIHNLKPAPSQGLTLEKVCYRNEENYLYDFLNERLKSDFKLI